MGSNELDPEAAVQWAADLITSFGTLVRLGIKYGSSYTLAAYQHVGADGAPGHVACLQLQARRHQPHKGGVDRVVSGKVQAQLQVVLPAQPLQQLQRSSRAGGRTVERSKQCGTLMLVAVWSDRGSNQVHSKLHREAWPVSLARHADQRVVKYQQEILCRQLQD